MPSLPLTQHLPPPPPSVAAAVACLAAALAATPCGVPRPRASSAAAAASPPPFSALWPARVALSLYATMFMAAQPLALDTPARALLPPSAAAWLAGGGGCRLHSALALGVGWPALTLTAAAVLAAPLSAAPARRAVSPIRGGKEVPTAAPLTAGPAIAVGALAALPALAAQTALAFAPHPPPRGRLAGHLAGGVCGWRPPPLVALAARAPIQAASWLLSQPPVSLPPSPWRAQRARRPPPPSTAASTVACASCSP